MTKPQQFPFYEKLHFFHFQKKCTIEKSDINALKSSSNQKIATNACINSANLHFQRERTFKYEVLFSLFCFFAENHHLNPKRGPPSPLP